MSDDQYHQMRMNGMSPSGLSLPETGGSVPAKPNTDPFDEDDCNYDDDPTLNPDWCDRCQGMGKVVTEDFESYFGANYKPCPVCGGDPCLGEPPTS